MKKLLLSTVALAGLTAGAMAADLPARRVAPAPFAAVPVFTWTGFYVGVNVGAAWNGNNRNDGFFGNTFDNGLVATGVGVTPVVPVGGTFGFGNGFGFNNGRNNDVGILGGLQIGYNWQVTPGNGLVLGVEADIQAIGNSNRNRNNGFGFGLANGGFGNAVPNANIAAGVPNVAFFNNGGGLNINGRGGSDWFGTARIRVGYAFDRFMLYATGGLAFKDDRNRGNNAFIGNTGIPAAFFVSPAAATAGAVVIANSNNGFLGFNNNDRNNVGWALGVGGEYAFTNNLSAKIEYLHLGFDRGNRNNGFGFGNGVVGVTNTGAPITQVNGGGFGFNNRRSTRNDVDLVRVGLNFRFGM